MARHRYAQPVENQNCVTTAFCLLKINISILGPIPKLLENVTALGHQISLGTLDASRQPHLDKLHYWHSARAQSVL